MVEPSDWVSSSDESDRDCRQCRTWCAMAVRLPAERGWEPRCPALAPVVLSDASNAIMLSSLGVPANPLAKAPCSLPSRSSRSATARLGRHRRRTGENAASLTEAGAGAASAAPLACTSRKSERRHVVRVREFGCCAVSVGRRAETRRA